MAQITIAVYRPLAGKEHELLTLVKEHFPILQSQDLVTSRKPVVMRAADGSIIEVFEWKSKQAIDQAHQNAVVQKLWEGFGNACEYVAPVHVAEFNNVFSEFEPVDF